MKDGLQYPFRQIPGGVETTDRIHYKSSIGVLGELVNILFIRRQPERIFKKYRFERVGQLLGKWVCAGWL